MDDYTVMQRDIGRNHAAKVPAELCLLFETTTGMAIEVPIRLAMSLLKIEYLSIPE
jgi:hypothetical protein